MTCATCGTPIEVAGTRRKFCSERCRKRQYDLACIDCGGRVSGTDPGKRRTGRCRPCQEAFITRPPEEIIAAIRKWAATHNGRPPTEIDWRADHPQSTPEQRAEYRAGNWPHASTVKHHFGSWNNGLRAAGFAPHLERDLTPAFEVLVAEVQAGHTARELAERYGVCVAAIYQKFTYRGLRISQFAPSGQKAVA